jgi:hypothetical protein
LFFIIIEEAHLSRKWSIGPPFAGPQSTQLANELLEIWESVREDCLAAFASRGRQSNVSAFSAFQKKRDVCPLWKIEQCDTCAEVWGGKIVTHSFICREEKNRVLREMGKAGGSCPNQEDELRVASVESLGLCPNQEDDSQPPSTTFIGPEMDEELESLDEQKRTVEKDLYEHPIAGPEELVEWLTVTRGPCAIVLCKGKLLLSSVAVEKFPSYFHI